MIRFRPQGFALLLGCLVACSAPPEVSAPLTGGAAGVADSRANEPASAVEPLRINILQMNDVYEIQPVSGGSRGGLSRVASIRDSLLRETPHTFTVMAGDFFSPSAIGTARVDGDRLAGRQMVSVLNALGLDFATFGNHEFDLNEERFRKRLAESQFRWISSNVMAADGSPLPGVEARAVLAIDASGEPFRIGIVAATMPEDAASYVQVGDPVETLARSASALDPEVDLLLAITHVSAQTDQRIAEFVPALDLIMGGHEHENLLLYRGDPPTPITKADGNAISVYIHRIVVDRASGSATIRSEFVAVDETIPRQPAVARLVDEWLERGYEGFRADGLDPSAVVTRTDRPLDGTAGSIRTRATGLTRLIGDALMNESGGVADLGLFNSGTVRIDDVIPAGRVTQYDVLRALPFPGYVLTAEVPGALLIRALATSHGMPGDGAFLQTSGNVRRTDTGYELNGELLDPARSYRVAMNDYLAAGRQSGLSFLNVTDPASGAREIARYRDMRLAVIDELVRVFPPAAGQ